MVASQIEFPCGFAPLASRGGSRRQESTSGTSNASSYSGYAYTCTFSFLSFLNFWGLLLKGAESRPVLFFVLTGSLISGDGNEDGKKQEG